jgi:hypothetical protein
MSNIFVGLVIIAIISILIVKKEKVQNVSVVITARKKDVVASEELRCCYV